MVYFKRLNKSYSSLLEEDEDDLEQVPTGVHRYDRQACGWWKHWSCSLLFLAYSITLVLLSNFWFSRSPVPLLAYTPAENAVKYHEVEYDGSLDKQTLFTGPPRPEVAEAWSRLFTNYNLRFTEAELQKLNRSSVALSSGGGFYGQLSVYHHLHCLKMLQEMMWQDGNNVSMAGLYGHADHCIEDIRQALMCHADLSVVTYSWRDDQRKPWANFRVDQTCIDWDALDGWAAQRSFSIFDQKSLVHPKLGISFPLVDGHFEIHEHMKTDEHEVHGRRREMNKSSD